MQAIKIKCSIILHVAGKFLREDNNGLKSQRRKIAIKTRARNRITYVNNILIKRLTVRALFLNYNNEIENARLPLFYVRWYFLFEQFRLDCQIKAVVSLVRNAPFATREIQAYYLVLT